MDRSPRAQDLFRKTSPDNAGSKSLMVLDTNPPCTPDQPPNLGDKQLDRSFRPPPPPPGKMLSATSKLWELVEVLHNKKWKCKLCGYEYDGGGTRIIAHFAGVGGYGIHGCKVVDARVRSEALKALQGERVVELSNKQGNVEEGLHQPVTASNDDASIETSIAAMLYLRYGAGSSASLPSPETNLPNQSHPALTDMPRPLNAEEGEPNTEVPHVVRKHVAPAKRQLGTHRLADMSMTSLKRNLEELVSKCQADMNKLKSKWRRIEDDYRSVVRAIREGIPFPPEKVGEVEELSKEVEEILLTGCSKISPLATIELVGKETPRKDFSVYALQEEIANAVGLDNLSNEKDVKRRAVLLHLKGLMVLDLSNTGITDLPNSISQLESLEALLLRNCLALGFIPYVGKLASLRKLDLEVCESLEEVPEGMEMLVNLRYLALDGMEIKTLPEGVLGKLVNLQYLAIDRLRAGEEVKLTKVEALHCFVANVETFNAMVRSFERNSRQWYSLAMGAPGDCCLWCMAETERRVLISSCDHIAAASIDGTSGDSCALLPGSVQSLELYRCHKMKRVMEWEWLTTLLPNLEEIIINSCEKLEEIISGPLPSGATCCLTYLGVNGCNNMKRVLLTQDIPPPPFPPIDISQRLQGHRGDNRH
ncbi:hypothetical protein NL676_024248 [Syzygium grande]|nr:hypothetical protein NL676_024248 [Syzygium grande]